MVEWLTIQVSGVFLLMWAPITLKVLRTLVHANTALRGRVCLSSTQPFWKVPHYQDAHTVNQYATQHRKLLVFHVVDIYCVMNGTRRKTK